MGPAYHRRKAAGLLSVRNTALFVSAVGLVALVIQIHQRKAGGTTMLAWTGGGDCHRYVKSLPFVENRDAIGRMLEEEEGMEVGIELGVQRGVYSETILSQWTKCKKYILVDLWGKQENYDDIANVEAEEQEKILSDAHSRLDKYKERGTEVEFMRMLTSEAAAKIPDGSLDFVYVDARHDYCGCVEDIELYWPKLREGGIMAGHDYAQKEAWEKLGQDWTLCQDGTHHPTAVVGAVNDFARRHDLQVVVPPFENWDFKSWMIRKPATVCGGAGGSGGGGFFLTKGAKAVEAALAADS